MTSESLRPFGGSRLRLGPMKFYADGSLIGHTALCSHPYGPNSDENGYLYRDAQEFSNDVLDAYRQGWSVGVHAQGDRAIECALDAMQRAGDAYAEQRPATAYRTCWVPDVGADRAHGSAWALSRSTNRRTCTRWGISSWRTLVIAYMGCSHGAMRLEAGVRVVISSDSDVASYRPLDTIAAAMSRTTEGGAVIGPEQTLTLNEALLAHTIDAAFAVGWEDEIGSLEPGKRADCTIVDGDLRAASAAEVRDLPDLVDGYRGTYCSRRPDIELESQNEVDYPVPLVRQPGRRGHGVLHLVVS